MREMLKAVLEVDRAKIGGFTGARHPFSTNEKERDYLLPQI